MLVQCNRPGGFVLRTPEGDLVKLNHGPNKVDAQKFSEAMQAMPEAWQRAVTTSQKHGTLPDIEPAGAETLPEVDSTEVERMSAVDKAKAVKAAATIEELNDMMEGEERKTVIDAANTRLAELQS